MNEPMSNEQFRTIENIIESTGSGMVLSLHVDQLEDCLTEIHRLRAVENTSKATSKAKTRWLNAQQDHVTELTTRIAELEETAELRCDENERLAKRIAELEAEVAAQNIRLVRENRSD